MNNPRLARRYAKSLIDLAMELKQLNEVHDDMLLLNSICKKSREFIVMLKSPIITGYKKYKIIQSLTSGKISTTTQTFIGLLSSKNRESNMPEIISSFILQFNEIKGIHKLTLTTAVPVSDEIKKSFIEKIEASPSINSVELVSIVDEKIIGGFVLEIDGRLIDASIQRDLNDVKKQFQDNEYIHKLR